MSRKRKGPSRYYRITHPQILAKAKANDRRRLREELDKIAAKAKSDAEANARRNFDLPPNLANQPVEELLTPKGRQAEDAEWVADHLWSE